MIIRIAALSFFVLLIAVSMFMAFVEFMEVTYSEQESYTTTETHYMKQSYTEEYPVDYEVTDKKIDNLWWRPLSDCSVIVHNRGEGGGFFRVQFDLVTQKKQEITRALWVEVGPGEQKETMVRHDGDYVVDFTCVVTPPVQVTTKYLQVPYTREIVKSRDVEKTKNVTLLEYLIDWQ